MHPTLSTTPLLHLASGDTLTLQTYRFAGTPGKKVYIQANLHGAEIAGNGVIQRLMDWLTGLEPSQLRGEIWLVPLCNPVGVNTRAHQFSSGRFNPYDGRDWNRIFWDYEQETTGIPAFAEAHLNSSEAEIVLAFRQQILNAFQAELAAIDAPQSVPGHRLYRTRLQAQAIDADVVIDLHSSSNQGMTYLYYFADRAASARLFGLDFAILLDDYDGDAFDESFIKPWLALERAFADLGRSVRFDIEAFTLELGTGMQIDPDSVERGFQGILHYLAKQGIVQNVEVAPTHNPEMTFSRTSRVTKYFAPMGGLVQNRVAPGTWVRRNTPLYTLLSFNKSGAGPQTLPVCAHGAGLVYDISTNQAVSQGEYVMAMLEPDEAGE